LKHVFHKIFSEIFFKDWFEETIIFEKLKELEKFLARCGEAFRLWILPKKLDWE
jgi:hypothetical protein